MNAQGEDVVAGTRTPVLSRLARILRMLVGMRKIVQASIERACAVPATTSSPCAFIRISPKNSLLPLEGLRVKPTPVPLVSPRLPKTMLCTLPRCQDHQRYC